MRTEIRNVSINWMNEWANRPTIEVKLDSEAVYGSLPWEKRDTLHRADFSNGEVHYFSSDGLPTHGFGGRTFEGKLTNGQTFKYKGAWSARAAVVNAYWPESPIIDVTIDPHIAGAILVDTLVEWYLENKPEWGLAVITDGDMAPIIEPTYPNGAFKPDTLYGDRVKCLARLNRDGSNRAEFMNAFKQVDQA